MKILIDTNIILDVLTKREPFYINSARVWTLVREEIIEGCISAISVNNLYYILSKLKGLKAAESFIDQILEDFGITGKISEEINRTNPEAMENLTDVCEKTNGARTILTILTILTIIGWIYFYPAGIVLTIVELLVILNYFCLFSF